MRTPIPILVLLTLLAAPAGAEDAQTYVESLRVALDEGRAHDAYRLGEAAAAAAPKDAKVLYLAARACAATFRLEEAETRIAEGLDVSPDDPALLGLYAWVKFLRDDDETAREAAELALRIDPGAREALDVMGRFDIVDAAKARAGGADPGLPSGSAAAFVDHAIDRVAHGGTAVELANLVDSQALADVEPVEKRRKALVVARIGELLEGPDRQVLATRGWVVDAVEQRSGDRLLVTVRLPSSRPIATTDPSIAALIESAPADERQALVQRISAARSPDLMTFDVALIRSGATYRISDLLFDAVSVRGAIASKSRDATAKAAERGGATSTTMLLVSAIVGTIILGGVFAVVVLAVRRRGFSARRGPGRGSRRS